MTFALYDDVPENRRAAPAGFRRCGDAPISAPRRRNFRFVFQNRSSFGKLPTRRVRTYRQNALDLFMDAFPRANRMALRQLLYRTHGACADRPRTVEKKHFWRTPCWPSDLRISRTACCRCAIRQTTMTGTLSNWAMWFCAGRWRVISSAAETAHLQETRAKSTCLWPDSIFLRRLKTNTACWKS